MGKRLKSEKKGTKTSSYGTNGRINHDSSIFYNSKLYQNIEMNQDLGKNNEINGNILNKIINASSEDMSLIPNNSVHLMITSPPYNVSKVYDENLSLEEYKNLLFQVFKETYRVLVLGGRACINIANVGRKPYIPLSDIVSKMMIEIGFLMRGEIIWDKGAGAGVSMAWGSFQSASNPVLRDVHEYILVFSKGDFQRQEKNRINTITKDQFMLYTKSIWSMNPESAKKVNHPAPFPLELPYRLIQLYSFKDDIILDPFIGSGTTALAALKSERYFIGYEINEEYVKLAEKRIKSFTSQETMEF